MKYFQLFFLLLIVSCGNEKVIQLPEISQSEISEILDVSPAYLFYDETQKDSIELNRKNLISSTNWLVNVDKRLTLDQAIPKIVFIQNKKKNSSHKKEGTKNYYTCNDTAFKILGFIEFTDVNYKTYKDEKGFDIDDTIFVFNVKVNSMDNILIDSYLPETVNTKNTIIKNLLSDIETIKTSNDLDVDTNNFTINLSFNRHLSFQDYISIKSLFKNFKTEGPTVSNNEYIY